MEVSKEGVDTNILLYSHQDHEVYRQPIAKELIGEHPVVSAQVVSEYLCEMEKKWRKAHPKGTPFDDEAKTLVLNICADNLKDSYIQHVDVNTLRHAGKLVELHHFQLRDAVIVASMVEAGCTILYSEDMDDGLKVDEQLYIKNPFEKIKKESKSRTA
jgi:predicted nucleic acid-binding protein